MADDEQRIAVSEAENRRSVWPLTIICLGLFALLEALPLALIILPHRSPPDGDFAGFYTLGKLLNEYGPGRLYDFALQQQICNAVHPRGAAYGPLPYPPFVGLFFRPFAWLPFGIAYLIWAAASLAVYLLSLNRAMQLFGSLRTDERWLISCLACCYLPFSISTAAGGQLSAMAVGIFVMVLSLDMEGRLFCSGLALSACLYKPTLLLLVGPFLLVTRRFRTVAGFAVGGGLIAAATTALEGPAVWPHWIEAMRAFSRMTSGAEGQTILILNKYADLMSFSAMLPGGRARLVGGLLVLFALLMMAALLLAWWRARGAGNSYTTVLWVTTLTVSLLLNVYVPAYDTILAVLALIVTGCVVRRLGSRRLWIAFHVLWVLLLAAGFAYTYVAERTQVQILTPVLAAIAAYQLYVLHRIRKSPDRQMA